MQMYMYVVIDIYNWFFFLFFSLLFACLQSFQFIYFGSHNLWNSTINNKGKVSMSYFSEWVCKTASVVLTVSWHQVSIIQQWATITFTRCWSCWPAHSLRQEHHLKDAGHLVSSVLSCWDIACAEFKALLFTLTKSRLDLIDLSLSLCSHVKRKSNRL